MVVLMLACFKVLSRIVGSSRHEQVAHSVKLSELMKPNFVQSSPAVVDMALDRSAMVKHVLKHWLGNTPGAVVH